MINSPAMIRHLQGQAFQGSPRTFACTGHTYTYTHHTHSRKAHTARYSLLNQVSRAAAPPTPCARAGAQRKDGDRWRRVKAKEKNTARVSEPMPGNLISFPFHYLHQGFVTVHSAGPPLGKTGSRLYTSKICSVLPLSEATRQCDFPPNPIFQAYGYQCRFLQIRP